MSTTDPGTGWIDPNPPDSTDPQINRRLTISAVVLTAVVLLSLIGVVLADKGGLFGGGTRGPSVGLIAANDPEEDAFMPSVVVSPVEIAGGVASDIESFTKQLPRSAGRGVRLVPGTQPGLYGAAGLTPACDVSAVANYLDAHPERAEPWARSISVPVQKVPYYLNTLTPVVLTADAWVTSSEFVEDRAVPAQVVLQAGNAVLVDVAGVPRVHCATGDPLTPPANVDLSTLTVEGEQWEGFTTQNVVAVAYAGDGSEQPVATDFELRDLTTGETVTIPAGGTIDIGVDPSGWMPDPVAMNAPPSKGMR